jgi:hypothetical protein
VSKNFFKQICPYPTIIGSQEINEHLRFDKNIGAGVILDKWVQKLNSIADPCVEILQESDPIFEIWCVDHCVGKQSLTDGDVVRQFGNKRILDVWPSLSESPIITQFDWAPLIQSAVQANVLLLQSKWHFWRKSADLEFFPELLTVHIRRGDYEQHCLHIAKWSARYNGFNDFESFREEENFSPPPNEGLGESTPENTDIYLKHCYPTVDQIVEKVMAVRSKTEGLRKVYIMTNAPASWLKELKSALKRAHRWDRVTSSRDMSLNWEQKFVGHAVDMMIAERSKAFIGNGVSRFVVTPTIADLLALGQFSSLTSNVVMLRMAKGLDPHTNHFW